MDTTADLSLRNIYRESVNVRRDLRWSRQQFADQDAYVVTDPITSKNYRIGLAEQEFISELEHGSTVGQALSVTSESLGVNAFTDEEAFKIVAWLLDEGLATSGDNVDSPERAARQNKKNRDKWSRLNPITIRVPLAQPDKIYSNAYPYIKPILGRTGFIVWLIAVTAALYVISTHWNDFTADTARMFSTSNLPWLILIWIGLKVIHESFHALVCKHYGGRVYEIGVFLILFIPLAYVDVSSMWQFRSKWKRIHVAVAGMYVELFIGAIAVFVWAVTDGSTVNYLAHNTVVVATVGTLFFNANVLMKFDGYHVLSDYVEMPNLYGRAQRQLLYFGQRLLLGNQVSRPQIPEGKYRFVVAYGICALMWRLFIMCFLIYLASRLLHGAGLIIAILAGVTWFVLPALRFIKFMGAIVYERRITTTRLAIVVLSLSAVLGSVAFVPLIDVINAPGYVEYEKPQSVRTRAPGFVRKVLVAPGQQVTSGDLIMVLENRDLEHQQFEAELQIKRAEIQQRIMQNAKNIAEERSIANELEILKRRYQEFDEQVDHLTLVADRGGVIIAESLADLVGQYLSTGTEVAIVANESKKIAKVFVSDRYSLSEEPASSQITLIAEASRATFATVDLKTTEPRVRHQIAYAGVTALGGGSLPVSTSKLGSRTQNAGGNQFDLVTPVTALELSLESQSAVEFFAGQRVHARIPISSMSIGQRIYQFLEALLSERQPQQKYL